MADLDALTDEDLSQARDRLLAGRKEARIPGSGYKCCEGWDGPCIQHRQFTDYEQTHGHLGKSRADRDNL
jgi:hypothetical protein